MMMYNTHCCAIMEIGRLKDYKTPEEAMVAFCKSNLTQPVLYQGMSSKVDTIYSFYMFTAANPSHHAVEQYGSRFKQFIEANKLGEVWESPARTNSAFHPDHSTQIYIWCPDLAALRKWWDAHLKATVPPEVKKPKPTQKVEQVVKVKPLFEDHHKAINDYYNRVLIENDMKEKG